MSVVVKRLVRADGLPEAFLAQLDENFKNLATPVLISQVTSNFTIPVDNFLDSIQVNATGGNRTITLPPPIGAVRFRIIKTDSSANTVTVSGNGYLINGSATYVLAAQYNKVWVESTGAGWLII